MGTLHSWSNEYYRYDTEHSDPRLQKFIEAMLAKKPVRFSERIFQIKVITITELRTEILLKEVED